ncbi:unnamed protein product, partial [Ostreobium quekettii]|eukprot:evm.model.scf_466.8 EVM.evm.TU.scf_466.8   scf_466:80791-82666(+)
MPSPMWKIQAGLFLLALFVPFLAGGHQADEGGWRPVPTCRSAMLVSILGRFREHVCLGTVVHRKHILTAAHCLEAAGPMPVIRAINGECSGRPQLQKELRAEEAINHPSWTGDVTKGYDIALLRLPRPLDVQLPLMASKNFDLYPNTKVDTFRLHGDLQTAQSVVVANALCPHLPDLPPQTFCIYSESGSMAT